jgi:Tfp pilus assembly protein PilO
MNIRQVLFALSALAVVGALGTVTVYYQAWRAETRRAQALTTELEGLELRVKQLREEQTAMSLAGPSHPTPATVPMRLPDRAEVAGVLELLELLSAQAGVHCQQVATPRRGTEDRQTYEIKGAGDPRGIATFLSLVERNPRILVVSSLEMSAQPQGTLQFAAVITAYHKSRGEHG